MSQHDTPQSTPQRLKCWDIRYYFRRGRARRLLQGRICGCMPGETRAAAVAAVLPDLEMDDDCTLVKVCASAPRKGHYCFTNARD